MGRRYMGYYGISSKKKNRLVFDGSGIKDIKNFIRCRNINKEELESYLRERDEKLKIFKSTFDNLRPILPKIEQKIEHIISLNSDMELDSPLKMQQELCSLPSFKPKMSDLKLPTFKREYDPIALIERTKLKHIVKNARIKTIKNRKNSMIEASKFEDNQVVINLDDYLTLTKKNVDKSNLKSVGEKSVKKTTMKKKVQKSASIEVSDKDGKKTFILVPQTNKNVDSVNLKTGSEKSVKRILMKQKVIESSAVEVPDKESEIIVLSVPETKKNVDKLNFKTVGEKCVKSIAMKQKVPQSCLFEIPNKETEKIVPSVPQTKKNLDGVNLKMGSEKCIEKIAMKQKVLELSPVEVSDKEVEVTVLSVPQTQSEIKKHSNLRLQSHTVVSQKSNNLVLGKQVDFQSHPLFVQKTPILINTTGSPINNPRPIILKAKLNASSDKCNMFTQDWIVLDLQTEKDKSGIEVLTGSAEASVTNNVKEEIELTDDISPQTNSQVFPVALKPSHSNDLELIRMFDEETNDSDSEMHILGF